MEQPISFSKYSFIEKAIKVLENQKRFVDPRV
jgi:hypothetical protein